MREGVRRSIFLTEEIDALIEKARKDFGINRSEFVRVCILKFLADIGYFKERMKKRII